MKQRLLLSTILSATLAIPAVAANVPEGTALAENQAYNYWMLDAIKSLDPQIVSSVEDSDAVRSLMEGLYNEDGDGNLVPGVALSHDLSEDKTTYTFHLRPEAKWSNGDPVTAGDFVYAWRRLADPATASEYAWYMELMQVVNGAEITAGEKKPEELGVTAIDDHTLEVKILAPLPYFPKMLTHTSVFPVNQKVVEQFGADWTKPGNYVGNGAYTLKDHIVGEKIVMEKSDSYWDAAKTVMSPVTGLTINDENAALTRYEAGELDRTIVPAGQYPRLKEEFPDEATSTPYSCSYTYIFNLAEGKGNEALKDVRVREALSYALDRDIVVNNILQGGQKSAYSWTHWAMNGFTMPEIDYSKWTQAERDEKAKALLAEAGFGPENPLKITLNYNTSEAHQKIAVAVQQMWKQKLGVEMTPQNFEWKVHTDKMNAGDFEMARYAWCADYNEASTFLDLWASYSGNNDAKYANAEYDALLKNAKTAADPGPDYTKAEEILAKDMAIIPIYHYAKVDMIKSDLKGLPQNNVQQTWYAKDLYRVAQ
ncbi:peptide ABC transporter substrate-binding protein [Frigidibacter sp. SD6-1]|uniref:peptide ABC transporter substrate-binding protein n=1 Tax=Frigidibacter sp. SD6-1 TaxID=3032581 RepID=UPI0024E03A18|nr:peptide ABC transporter substrate-binding protein [Frigidibacter sp. SD6-1]